ncbi:hypothetical protein CEXT_150361 [Caerostris extrusa]|uniref:Uncharacterized protein n=1 Tax=Caerostris extrusa TaxID=172846 RepID=A0AAV4XH11_CAEEX|nr:hypothetical protein CEXT_150361 [Caerostris extrusa]
MFRLTAVGSLGSKVTLTPNLSGKSKSRIIDSMKNKILQVKSDQTPDPVEHEENEAETSNKISMEAKSSIEASRSIRHLVYRIHMYFNPTEYSLLFYQKEPSFSPEDLDRYNLYFQYARLQDSHVFQSDGILITFLSEVNLLLARGLR